MEASARTRSKTPGLTIVEGKSISHQIEFEFQGKTRRLDSEDEDLSGVVGASVMIPADPNTDGCTSANTTTYCETIRHIGRKDLALRPLHEQRLTL